MEVLKDNDPVTERNLTIVKQMSENYRKGESKHSFVHDAEHEGITYRITFYTVGHNASHSFSLGVDSEGAIWSYASGEDGWDHEKDEPIHGVHVQRIGFNPDEIGYVGHY